MTDHTTIIERMARELEGAGLHPIDAQEAAERALSASGLLEVLDASLGGLATIVAMRSVLEKSQQSKTKPSFAFCSDAMWRVAMADYDASETALRNTIKGVRERLTFNPSTAHCQRLRVGAGSNPS